MSSFLTAKHTAFSHSTYINLLVYLFEGPMIFIAASGCNGSDGILLEMCKTSFYLGSKNWNDLSLSDEGGGVISSKSKASIELMMSSIVKGMLSSTFSSIGASSTINCHMLSIVAGSTPFVPYLSSAYHMHMRTTWLMERLGYTARISSIDLKGFYSRNCHAAIEEEGGG